MPIESSYTPRSQTLADLLELERLRRQMDEGALRNAAAIGQMRRGPIGYGGMGGPMAGDSLTRSAQDRMAQLYLQQHFPGYASGPSVNTRIGKNVYAPRLSRGGRHGGYGDGYYPSPGAYSPRVVATGGGTMTAPIAQSLARGTITSPTGDWTGPREIEQIARDQENARLASDAYNVAVPMGMQPTSRGYMWIGGPEGDQAVEGARYLDEWANEIMGEE